MHTIDSSASFKPTRRLKLLQKEMISIPKHLHCNDNSGEVGAGGNMFTWIVVIKFLSINLPSQPFLGYHLWFCNLFTLFLFKKGPHLFLQCRCFGIDHHNSCVRASILLKFGTLIGSLKANTNINFWINLINIEGLISDFTHNRSWISVKPTG